MSLAYVIALALAISLVATCEWRTDEDTITLGAILAVSFALGAFKPKLFWLTGIVIGLVIEAVQAVAFLTGWRPIYEQSISAPPTTLDWRLLVLILPAVFSAVAGALLASAIQRQRRSSDAGEGIDPSGDWRTSAE